MLRTIGETAAWVQDHLLPYDALPYAKSRNRTVSRCALLLLVAYVILGFTLIGLNLIDNKPTTASTGLATAHRMVTMNFSGWFHDGIWWRGQQTPTPLPYTIYGVFFALFGYSIHGILMLHTVAGAVAGWLLFLITSRRFGPWSGVLALLMYLSTPLVLYVNFSGWTFVWATLFLLLSINLLDRAVMARRIPLYLVAGLALGCAGMSRPENYAVALLVVLFVEIPIRYRMGFLLLAFAYPIAQYMHNNLYLGDDTGLRILEDPRAKLGYFALFEEWFASVKRHILNRNYDIWNQYAMVPAVLLPLLRRRRFLTAVLIYFFVAFFAAYAMRRISFNHEGYYYAHVTLLAPFLAGLLVWQGAFVARVLRATKIAPLDSHRVGVAVGSLTVAGILLFQAYCLRDSYGERLLFRVPEPVREVRDFLQAHLENDDRVALDYFTEVSWMLAEIECDGGRDAWYYNTNMTSEPRPRVNAVRKDLKDEEFALVNQWVGANFRLWAAQRPPKYLVTQSDDAWMAEWARKGATGHYRLFSLRPALGVVSLDRISLDTLSETMLLGKIVFENDLFSIYEIEPSGSL